MKSTPESQIPKVLSTGVFPYWSYYLLFLTYPLCAGLSDTVNRELQLKKKYAQLVCVFCNRNYL